MGELAEALVFRLWELRAMEGKVMGRAGEYGGHQEERSDWFLNPAITVSHPQTPLLFKQVDFSMFI